MTSPTRPASRTAFVLAAVVLASLAFTDVPTRPAAAAEGDGLVTTSSTQTKAWAARHPDDSATAPNPATYQALKDFQLRVSQTRDLLNQTVQVSWTGGATTGNGTFLQLMQCWSDGPDVPPTREQCAYGGIDREGAEGTGAGRTRALGEDPRERTYRNDGDLNVVSVNGAVAGPSWPQDATLVLGTNQQVCPAGTVSHTLTLVPPKAAVTAGILPASVVVQGPNPGPPASLKRQEGAFERTYASVTDPFRLSDTAAANRLRELPLGQYRFQLGCSAGDGLEVTRFVGYLEQVESTSRPVWRRSFREGGVFVPFDPLGDTPDTAATDPYARDEILEYLKPRSTNEIWQARTRPDGGGSVVMEMQTDFEAQHLGCGRVDAAQVRSCWVVAIPRWTTEPNGAEPNTGVLYSPLSQTLWDRRIQVPLAFAPVATGCKIGSGLKQVLTNDIALAAFRSWQPTFCDDAATASSVLGPLQDFSVRGGFDQPNRMGVVTVPDEVSGTLVTAPVTTSGVVIGFAVDRQLPFGSAKFALDGTRATVMNLNARLVGKLLTQSYDTGAAPNGGKTTGYNGSVYSGGFTPTFTPPRNFPAGNPRTLYNDPEFLRLNPDFKNWLDEGGFVPATDMADVLVSANDTDAYQILWQWILGDPDARAFLDGQADADGMLINPYYKGQINASTSSFPLFDPTCVDNLEAPEANSFPLLCQINNHPRVDDDTDATQAAIRGDTKRVNVAPPLFSVDPSELSYKPEPRQSQGKLGMLVVTSSAVAERFGLPMARLQNADGDFVAATSATMAKARDQMKIRGDGVLVSEPAAVRDGGYPLTANSYAVVDVAATTQPQNDAFAAILTYAAGDGQRTGTAIGQLPPGYAPLTPALAAQSRAAAALLRDPSSLLAGGSEDQAEPGLEPSAVDDGSFQPDSASGPESGSDAVPADEAPSAGGAEADEATGLGTDAGTTSAETTTVDRPLVAAPVVATTSPFSSLRWTIPVLLIIGLLAGLAGRVLPRFGRIPS